MEEVLLREVLSEEHHVGLDRRGAERADGNFVAHDGHLMMRRGGGVNVRQATPESLGLPWPPRRGTWCSTGDRKLSGNCRGPPPICPLGFRRLGRKREKLVSVPLGGWWWWWGGHSLTLLQPVDVLRVHAQQQALVVQHADEVVDVVGPVAPGVERLGQGEERLRVVGEVVDVEDGLRVGNVVLLQVGVQARSRSSEAEGRSADEVT